MPADDVLREANRTGAELLAAGFRYYERRPQTIMVRELPPEEAPLTIETAWDTLVADAGYLICFAAGDTVCDSLYAYPHWPVRPDHFRALYRALDDPDWQPTPGQEHLLALGCEPYCRAGGVWAQRLTSPRRVQSTESPEPVLVPAGAWVCIAAGAPYSMDDTAFQARYTLPSP